MTQLVQALHNWGADTSGALERLMQDTALYEECLRLFAQDAAFAALEQAMAAGSWQAAFEQAHTLKGVAANLGLSPLLQVLQPVSQALRHAQYEEAARQYPAVVQAHRQYCALVNAAPPG